MSTDNPKRLVLYTDGGCDPNPGQMAIAAMLYEGKKEINRLVMLLPGEGTNNVAEYTALIEGLKMAARHECDELVCFLDSKLIVRQLSGEWRIKKRHLDDLVGRAIDLLSGFEDATVKLTSRAHPRIRRCDRLLHQARMEATKGGTAK